MQLVVGVFIFAISSFDLKHTFKSEAWVGDEMIKSGRPGIVGYPFAWNIIFKDEEKKVKLPVTEYVRSVELSQVAQMNKNGYCGSTS